MIEQVARKWPVFSNVWMIFINFVFFLVALLMIGLSSWGISYQASNSITTALPANALKLTVSIGVFLLLTSIFGWVGVKYNHSACGRYTLGIYATILVFLILLEWIAAGIVVTFVGSVNAFVPSQVQDLSPAGLLINATFATCCCPSNNVYTRCDKMPVPVNLGCWVPGNLPYPCDSLASFSTYLESYIDSNLVPLAVIMFLISFLQLFTSVTACCSQCRGKTVEQQKKIATGPVSYDGLYEGDENYAGYGYENYVKNGGKPGAPGAPPPPPPGVGGAKAPPAPGK